MNKPITIEEILFGLFTDGMNDPTEDYQEAFMYQSVNKAKQAIDKQIQLARLHELNRIINLNSIKPFKDWKNVDVAALFFDIGQRYRKLQSEIEEFEDKDE